MRIRTASIVILWCCFTFAQVTVAQTTSEGPVTEKERLHQRLMECITDLRFSPAEDATKAYPRYEQPLLDYQNPLFEGQSAGLLVLWHDQKVPLAVASFSERHGDRIFREFSSLTEKPFLCKRGDQLLWSPKSTGQAERVFPSAQPPRTTKALRLVQMRRMAERFEVNKGGNCRLLPQPLYRFESPEQGIIDGAVFAFVVANDPELLLTVTLNSSTGDLEDAAWNYSLARMTSSPTKVGLDGQEVWQAAGYWRNPRSKSDSYMEALDRRID